MRRIKSKIIFASVLVLVLFSCRKIVLTVVANSWNGDIWEKRPEGIACTPAASANTMNGDELTFADDHMLCVSILMNPEDFDVMRHESRFGPSTKEKDGGKAAAAALEYLGQCDVPFASYYNWYSANIQIDGIQLSNVGIRKKGFLGSIFSVAPSIKIDTEKHVPGQSLSAIHNITLNNNSEDPSRLMHVLNYKLFELAGYPAPRANLANVSVNGEALGVYTHLEAVDEHFLELNFGNSSGDLYEGQLVDFRTDWVTRWEVKTDQSDPYKASILKVAEVLETASDENLIAELDQVMNIDNYLRFWAMEVMLRHLDGYAANRNNFIIYFDPNDSDRLTFIPWGLNYFRHEGDESIERYLGGEIPRRLSRVPETNQKMEDELRFVMDSVWNETTFNLLLDNFAAQVQTGQNDPNYSSISSDVKNWMLYRKSEVEAMIQNGIPQGNANPVKKCYGGK